MTRTEPSNPAPTADSKPWWADGLPFSCQQSGKCCHQRGGYGYVYVNARERQRIADELGVSLGSFNRRFTRSEEDGARVLRFVDGACIFLQDGLCSVHEVKPVQCRTWPFWEELLASPEVYEREVRAFCPGSRQGPRVDPRSIRAQMEETEAALWEV